MYLTHYMRLVEERIKDYLQVYLLYGESCNSDSLLCPAGSTEVVYCVSCIPACLQENALKYFSQKNHNEERTVWCMTLFVLLLANVSFNEC